MNLQLVHIIWTVLLIIIFLGIILWAWSSRNTDRFREAAALPLQDDLIEQNNSDDRKTKTDSRELNNE